MCTPMSETRVRELALRPALSRRRRHKHYTNRIPVNMLKISSSKY